MSGTGRPDNVREARKRRDRQQLALVLGTLILVGGALIALIYGPAALLSALPCLLAAGGLIGVLFGLLALLDRVLDGRGR